MNLRNVLIVVAVILLPLIANAYEEDVHYGLTKWLAIKANFSLADAELIAHADVMVDGRATDAVSLVAFYACLGSDQGGSQLVRENHFPTTGPVPSVPSKRQVLPNSPIAQKQALDIIQNPMRGSDDNQRYSLEKLGQGLHAFQDSFSHQGTPDVPRFFLFKCDEQYAWGHPVARGGWREHNADITSIYPQDADDMAKATYELLCLFNSKVRNSPCKIDWIQLAPNVQVFNRATTKSSKLLWFTTNKTPLQLTCDSISHIHIDNGEDWSCPKTRNIKSAGKRLKFTGSEDSVPSDEAESAENPTDFVTAALETWLVKGDTVALAQNYVDQSVYIPWLKREGFDYRDPLASLSKYFALALIDDDQQVANSRDKLRLANEMTTKRTFGADGSSRISSIGFSDDDGTLVSRTSESAFVKFDSLAEALLPIGKTNKYFQIELIDCNDGAQGKCAVAVGMLRDKAPQYLILELQKSKKRWRIVRDDRFDPF